MDFSSVSSPASGDTPVTIEDQIETGVAGNNFKRVHLTDANGEKIRRGSTYESECSDVDTEESSIASERSIRRIPILWLLPCLFLAFFLCSFGASFLVGTKYINNGNQVSPGPIGITEDPYRPKEIPNSENITDDNSSDESGHQFTGTGESSSTYESSPQETNEESEPSQETPELETSIEDYSSDGQPEENPKPEDITQNDSSDESDSQITGNEETSMNNEASLEEPKEEPEQPQETPEPETINEDYSGDGQPQENQKPEDNIEDYSNDEFYNNFTSTEESNMNDGASLEEPKEEPGQPLENPTSGDTSDDYGNNGQPLETVKPTNITEDNNSDQSDNQANDSEESSNSTDGSSLGVPSEELQELESLVGVYYYTSNDTFSDGNYLRVQLDPPQFPELGSYNGRDTSVISKHFQWTRDANINLWVLEWQGPGTEGDITARNHIMKHPGLPGTKIAMHYNAQKRIPADTLSTVEVYADIDYMARMYFSNPNYLTIDGSPVVYVYLTRLLESRNILGEVIGLIRNAAADNGFENIYVVGDHAYANAPEDDFYAAFDTLDAVTNFDVYGSMGMRHYAYESGVEAYKEKQMKWKDAAALQGCGFIPSVTPGFNNMATRDGLTAMSRRISPNAPIGSLFQSLMTNGLELVDNSAGKILMINSWNMWGEDTQIEPVSDAGDTNSPMSMTQDLNYGSYGSVFLDIVRAATTGETLTLLPVEEAPHDNGLTVGVYYYPWHGNNDFHGKEYLRGELEPPQLPYLGEYSDRDPDIVAQHLEWTRSANVKLWVTSWWGPGSTTDITTRDVIMKHPDLPGTKIALFYEATRLATNGALDNQNIDLDMGKIQPDFDYMAKTYFSDPNYYKIDGRPVVYVYLARALQGRGDLVEFVDRVKNAVKENGYDIYIVGDAAFKSPGSSSNALFESLDAVTNYDMYGSLGRPRHVGEEGVARYRTSQGAWRQAAKNHGGCDFVPALGPGYNDRGVRPQNDHAAMSRRLTPDAPEGSLFSALLPEAFKLADPDTGGIVMINSFNEWHEDSQIEPVVDVGLTAKPSDLTQDLEYPAYGKLYLNILRDAILSYKPT